MTQPAAPQNANASARALPLARQARDAASDSSAPSFADHLESEASTAPRRDTARQAAAKPVKADWRTLDTPDEAKATGMPGPQAAAPQEAETSADTATVLSLPSPEPQPATAAKDIKPAPDDSTEQPVLAPVAQLQPAPLAEPSAQPAAPETPPSAIAALANTALRARQAAFRSPAETAALSPAPDKAGEPPPPAIAATSPPDAAAAPPAPATPAPQRALPPEAVPMTIASMAKEGVTTFDIRLDPGELGRVEVRLSIDHEGAIRTHMVVERPETLQLLRADSPRLDQAFADAGLSAGSASFSLRSDGGQGQQAGRPPHGASDAQPDTADPTLVASPPPARLSTAAARLDLLI